MVSTARAVWEYPITRTLLPEWLLGSGSNQIVDGLIRLLGRYLVADKHMVNSVHEDLPVHDFGHLATAVQM